MTSSNAPAHHDGLSLCPFRGLRPAVDEARLGRLLCPPYDVIDAKQRRRLLDADPDNAVGIILPQPTPAGYADAAERLSSAVERGLFKLDGTPALYVYEMAGDDGSTTRGLLGAVELRAPEDGVILPHENTMAGPVADRLELMTATDADLEPIYLVYDGGGDASRAVRDASHEPPLATARTPDGLTHRLWAISDAEKLTAISADLGGRRALIADGHHRYATYRERQRLRRAVDGPGPWDRGLALVVDSSDYGPQVHAIHRVVVDLSLTDAVAAAAEKSSLVAEPYDSPEQALAAAHKCPDFAVALTDGQSSYVLSDRDNQLVNQVAALDEVQALGRLDVTVVHRGLVETVWERQDDVDHVHYAHSVAEAVADARAGRGVAVLVRPTPVADVTAVAAAGARMPRKSTLFTPKPASGLVVRRLSDQPA